MLSGVRSLTEGHWRPWRQGNLPWVMWLPCGGAWITRGQAYPPGSTNCKRPLQCIEERVRAEMHNSP